MFGKKNTDSNQKNLMTISVEEANARAKIGRQVTYFALSVTGLLGVTSILVAILAPKEELSSRFQYVKDALTIVLPLIGTWVGTVLAFYFTKENFAAAAKNTSELIQQLTPDQKLQSIQIVDVMIRMDDPSTVKLVLIKEEDAVNIKIKADILVGIIEKFEKNRLPIVDESGKVLYIMHRSFIDKFISKKTDDVSVKIADLTLKDLLAVDEYKNAFLSHATVDKTAKMIAVKEAMNGNSNCSDVFVTENGSRNIKAIGWVTNVMVREHSLV